MWRIEYDRDARRSGAILGRFGSLRAGNFTPLDAEERPFRGAFLLGTSGTDKKASSPSMSVLPGIKPSGGAVTLP